MSVVRDVRNHSVRLIEAEQRVEEMETELRDALLHSHNTTEVPSSQSYGSRGKIVPS